MHKKIFSLDSKLAANIQFSPDKKYHVIKYKNGHAIITEYENGKFGESFLHINAVKGTRTSGVNKFINSLRSPVGSAITVTALSALLADIGNLIYLNTNDNREKVDPYGYLSFQATMGIASKTITIANYIVSSIFIGEAFDKDTPEINQTIIPVETLTNKNYEVFGVNEITEDINELIQNNLNNSTLNLNNLNKSNNSNKVTARLSVNHTENGKDKIKLLSVNHTENGKDKIKLGQMIDFSVVTI